MARSKLEFLGLVRVNSESTWSKLLKFSEMLGFDLKLWKVLFCKGFDLVWPSVNPRLTRGILVILAKKVLWVLQRPNGLRHIILDVLMAPWRENNIFGYFGIRHANREQTKYSINSILYIIIIVFIFIFIFY